jgi:hypothetical protein
MPVRGLFDFDGLPVLVPGEDYYGRQVFPLVETANTGVDPSQGLFGSLGSDDGEVTAPTHNLWGGLLGGDGAPTAPGPYIDLLGGLLGGGSDEPEAPSAPGPVLTIFDWLFNGGVFGGNDTPQDPPASGDGHWEIVGLFGGRVWVPAEPAVNADELGLVICPADQPISGGNAIPAADLFGSF